MIQTIFINLMEKNQKEDFIKYNQICKINEK